LDQQVGLGASRFGALAGLLKGRERHKADVWIFLRVYFSSPYQLTDIINKLFGHAYTEPTQNTNLALFCTPYHMGGQTREDWERSYRSVGEKMRLLKNLCAQHVATEAHCYT